MGLSAWHPEPPSASAPLPAPTPAPTSAGRRPWRRAAPFLLLALLVALAYANALENGFAYDDKLVVLDHPSVRSLAGIPSLLGEPFHPRSRASTAVGAGTYRPFALATVALDWALWGPNPFGHHLTSLLCHLLACFAVYVFYRTMLPRARAALLAAALFAVHPVHTEAVTAVANRGDVLATLFCLLALLSLRGAFALAAPRRFLRVAAACLLLFLGLLSKEMAFMLPALLVLLLLWDRVDRRAGGPGWIPAARPSAPAAPSAGAPPSSPPPRSVALWVLLALAVPVVAALLPRLRVEGDLPHMLSPLDAAGARGAERAAILAQACAQHLRLLLAGGPLAANYPENSAWLTPAAHHDPFRLAWSVGLLALAALACAVSLRRAPLVALVLAWFVVALVPVSQLLVPAGVVISERALYLPSVGICAALGWALDRVLGVRAAAGDRGARRRQVCAWALAAAWLGAWAGACAVRNRDWRDDLTLARSMVRDQPRAPQGWTFLGDLLVRLGSYDEAESCYRALLALPGAEWAAYDGLGRLLQARSDWAGAAAAWTEAVRRLPGRAELHARLAGCLVHLARPAEAEAEYVAALRLDPDAPGRLRDLGLLLLRFGREPSALPLLRRAAVLESGGAALDEAALERSFGRDALRIDRPDLALPHLLRAATLRPADDDIRLDLGIARYLAEPDPAAALADVEAVLEHAPGRPDALRWRGILLRRLGRFAAAADDLEAALRAEPFDYEAARHLFLADVAAGRIAAAQDLLRRLPELARSEDPELRAALRALPAPPGR
ncbi:MAG: tetratricopeptide repeat protein [Planctomycetes bacterium]|nr:tetratricopeptide repeat protein [Planctomycetota bacterium]